MPRWTVGELKERLDDFGDHIPVVVVTGYGENDEKHNADYDVDDGTVTDADGDPTTGVILVL